MTLATPTKYNVLKSIEGNLLGLDQSSASLLKPGGVVSVKGKYAPFLMGHGFQGMRLFPIDKDGLSGSDYKVAVNPYTHISIWDDFVGKALDTFKWAALVGSNAQASPALVAGALNGVCRLTTGAGSTHTMAVNGEQLVGDKNAVVANNGLRFEARLGNLSAATSQSFCFGLIDSTALSAPFTLSVATVTANATNAACFLQDAAGTNTGLNAVAVNAGGSPQVVALPAYSINTTANAFDVYRVEIDVAGNATFFIDGVLVATIALAVATTAALAPSVGGYSQATTAGTTLDIDYIHCQYLRG